MTLLFHSEDDENCRIYYKRFSRLFCWQLRGLGIFDFYACTQSGEPRYKVALKAGRTPLPPGETKTGLHLIDFLRRGGCCRTITGDSL